MSTRGEVIEWLREAYAKERGLEDALSMRTLDGELAPGVRAQAELQLAQTRQNAEAVKLCLQQLGSDPSTIETGAAPPWRLARSL